IDTYARGQRLSVVEVDSRNGVTDLEKLKQEIDENTACVMVQYPNFFGQLEPLTDIEKLVHEQKAMFVVSSNPLALGRLTPP
ncbi:aminotransferase class V-fold PLP-dependent enzyme, partial [Micrococcus sp. SIMBA_144]